MRIATLSVIISKDTILLGRKKTSFGKGFYNGFGGKLEKDETIDECMIREIQEEAGISVASSDMCKCGIITFLFPNASEWDQEVHIYAISKYSGNPIETDEMMPKSFPLGQIPYAQMWPSDKDWLPLVLRGKKLVGEFTLDENGKVIDSVLTQVKSLDGL